MEDAVLCLILMLLTMRPAYLLITFCLSTDILDWREMLFPWERPVLRIIAQVGMSKEEKKAVDKMRERIKRGLPTF
jgi:Mg2+/citrate symporter